MNGQIPNNQVNNDSQLNANVLGNVSPVGPMPNNNPVGETLGAVNNSATPQSMPNMAQTPVEPQTLQPNVGMKQPQVTNTVLQQPASEPVAVPIPGTEGTPGVNNLMGATVGNGTPLMGQDNINTNNFITGQKMDNIGAVPPQETDKKGKKSGNKLLFILLIIVLIAAVALGVYYVLNFTNNKVKLTTKDVTIGVGETVPDKVTDFAKIEKGDASKCNLNTRNVNSSEIGEYEYTITCGDDTYKGKVIVSDVTAPVATLKPVFKGVGETVTVEDFIEACTDPSECTTTFKDEAGITELLSTPGRKTVVIVATDKSGNSKEYEAEIYVTALPVFAFTTCSSSEEQLNGYQATKVVSDVFPIGRDAENESEGLKSLEVAKRKYKYVFTSEQEYKNVVGAKESEITFDNITGSAYYDDEALTLYIVTDLSMETLKSENNGEFPLLYSDFQQLYTSKNYTCSNGLSYSNK